MKNAMIDLQRYGGEMWQDRLIYNMRKAIRDLCNALERMKNEQV